MDRRIGTRKHGSAFLKPRLGGVQLIDRPRNAGRRAEAMADLAAVIDPTPRGEAAARKHGGRK